ncbi:HET-domain-containing protein [Tothia fuscella]|uniref:HET-domain-containing protein n=1 Tax=Tothia fuscella TaxID=1048955 RepID=A0A9P4NKZ2_9PEZI|nr:HET-domain-containing protein [Tothia fuscella]
MSDKCFDFISKRVEHCISSDKHKLCHASPSNVSPARLLDVSGDHVRLGQTKRTRSKYIALSHCWGSDPLLCITGSTLAQHQDDIDWGALRSLFRDAVQSTRRLGVRYLWIDSLCIIQDSKEDWEIESTKMCDIFEQAHLVLSAVDCASSGQHCLLPRQRKLKIQYKNSAGKDFQLYARPIVDHHPNTKEQSPFNLAGPLMTRAWALQEQALPNRIVHFTSTELVFECKTTSSCECRPSPRSHPTTPGLLAKSLLCKKDKAGVFSTWHHFINSYTLKNITRLSDRLPAISGIAHKVQRSTGSVYLAGIWQDHVANDLLWLSAPFLQNPHLATRVDEYRAPSFSWASVETQVQYEKADRDVISSFLLEFIETQSIPAGLNPLGEVIEGSLTIRAPFMEGIIFAPTEDTFHYSLKVGGQTLDVSPDTLLIEATLKHGVEERQIVRRAREDEVHQSFKVPVICLAVSTSSDQRLMGLVLSSSTRVDEAFERLGMFICSHRTFEDVKKTTLKLV